MENIITNLKPKTILAVWNAGSRGKTDSLRHFASELITSYSSYISILPIPAKIPSTGDFRLIVEINGVRIGIETQGDPRTNLHNRLIDLVTVHNCDIIFCACRTRGETVAAIENIEDTFGFQTIWTSTYQIADSSQHNIVNKLKGVHILALIQNLGLI